MGVWAGSVGWGLQVRWRPLSAVMCMCDVRSRRHITCNSMHYVTPPHAGTFASCPSTATPAPSGCRGSTSRGRRWCCSSSRPSRAGARGACSCRFGCLQPPETPTDRPSNQPTNSVFTISHRFEGRFEAGHHYIPFAYDLSTLLPTADRLIESFTSGRPRPPRQLASEAAGRAAEVFDIMSQLDSLAWTAARVRQLAGPPAGGEPAAESGWRLLKLRRGAGGGSGWKSPALRAAGMGGFRRAFVEDMKENLQ